MKQNKNELDVDFIGGHTPLTAEEAKAISAYIKAKQLTPKRQIKKRSQKREKVTV